MHGLFNHDNAIWIVPFPMPARTIWSVSSENGNSVFTRIERTLEEVDIYEYRKVSLRENTLTLG